jgi:signal transduction histidine kinase/ligand-binding sensor domain-containing protein
VWAVEDGLPQNSVNDILQTRDGYLWLATFGGLVRFDGVRFVVFDRATPGVRSLRILSLHEDRAGTLWAGTDDGMLLRYRDDRFTTFDGADGFHATIVLRIDEDAAGGLWLTSIDRVVRYDGTRFDAFEPGDFPRDVRPRDGPTVARPGAIRNRAAVWWSHDARGVHCLVAGRVELCLPASSLPGPPVAVTRGRAGDIWVQTVGAGIVRRVGDRIRRYTANDGLPDVPDVRQLFEDRDGTLWIHQFGGPVHRIRDGASRIAAVRDVQCHFEDREGSIWFGSASQGLLRVRHHVISMLTRDAGLSSNNVYALLRGRAGGVWVGTWGGGLNHVSGDRIEVLRASDGLPSDMVAALHEDRAGRLLVGTPSGVAVVDRGRPARHPDPNGWLAGNVWAIHEDADGTLWFGTDHGLVRRRGDDWTRFTAAGGLADDVVGVLLRGGDGGLWIGTRRGLSRLHDGRITSYGERDGLVGNHVRALAERDGALWVGTYDGGLYRLAGGRLTRFTTRDGLHDNGIFQLLDDGAGYFWSGSNRGISRISRSDLQAFAEGRARAVPVTVFGLTDGLTSLECNGGRQPSGLRMDDGTLWVPTQGGIARIHPARVRANRYRPPVRIEEIRVGGRAVVPGAAGVEVPPDRRSFDVEYTALSFIKAGHVRFRYRLRGADEEWVDAGTRRVATYHGVAPGRYVFEVTAANADGVWNADGAALAILVRAPVWRQGWFLALLALAALAVVVWADRRRILRLRREHGRQLAYARQLLDTQEQERRRISNELHDSLGQTLLLIRQRSRLAQESPGPEQRCGEHLEAIADLAGRAADEMKEIAYNLRPYHLDKIGLTRTIDGMLRRVSRACGLSIAADIEPVDDVFPAEAQIGVYRIVQEGLNNIVRHAAATEAGVSIRRTGGDVVIEIRDNGVGFTPQGDRPGAGGPPPIGLGNLQERARALNGTLTVRSHPGHGTTLLIRLATGETHVQ